MRIIAGRWRGRTLRAPAGRETRPTADRVREAWMSALQFDLSDARVLDLFAGSGALGLEALSRGAAHVTFVERAARPLAALRANIAGLDAAEACTVVRADVLTWVPTLDEHAFDLALADPPYGLGLAERLAESFAVRPFAGWLWIEHGADERLPDIEGAERRRYGDTALTRIPAPEHSQ
jgi:16S rRNA (guanine966-N2)-methyltransferase